MAFFLCAAYILVHSGRAYFLWSQYGNYAQKASEEMDYSLSAKSATVLDQNCSKDGAADTKSIIVE